jgi:THO complex subunit 2
MVSSFKYRGQYEIGIMATHSRNILISPHCNPSDPNCADVLTTAYHTLLCSTLSTWSPEHPLTADAFLAFVQSVLDGLPSSSSTSSSDSSNTALFGEIVVDMVWSIDAELDEILADAKVAIANVEQGSESGKLLCYENGVMECRSYITF